MTFMYNGLQIEVKAKWQGEGRATKQAAMSALNSLSLWAYEASKMYRLEGCNALAKDAKKVSDEIHDILEAAGCYKDLGAYKEL